MNALAFIALMAGIVGLWLVQNDKWDRFVTIVEAPATTGTGGVGAYVVAFIVYLIVLSVSSTETGYWVTGILILGAFLVDHEKMGSNDFLSVITGAAPSLSGAPAGSTPPAGTTPTVYSPGSTPGVGGTRPVVVFPGTNTPIFTLPWPGHGGSIPPGPPSTGVPTIP